MGSVCVFTGEYEKMRGFMFKGLEIARKYKDKHWEAVFETNVGNYYMYTAQHEKAVAYFQKGLKLFEQNNEPEYFGRLYHFLAIAYLNMSNMDKSIEYAEKALKKATEDNIPKHVGDAENTIGKAYIEKEQPLKALPHIEKALKLFKETGEENVVYDCYFDLSRIAFAQKQYTKAIKLAEEAVTYNTKVGNLHNNINTYCMLAQYYQADGNMPKSLKTIEHAMDLARKNDMKIQMLLAYETAAKLYNDIGRFDDAYRLLKEQQTLNDSINSIELRKKLTESDARFQAAQKEQKIVVLEAEKSRQKVFIAALGSVIVLLLLSVFLLFRYFAAKRKIAQQQITQLQQEKKIVAAENLLEGEKTERTRLARDLHDGLGGMLSGVKFQLNSMKGNVILSEENAEAFTKSIAQIDGAISEMRRVAHNMMPESLLKFGLNDAVGDYCQSLAESSGLSINFQSFGMESRLQQTTEITVYRIIQELLNNVVKHAGASEVQLQLSRNEDTVSLTVEDDGTGFDTASGKAGMGLSNIRDRVDYLNGKLDVQGDGKGTSVHIEFEEK